MDVTKLALPLTYDPHGGRIVDANGRTIAFLDVEVDDMVALELLQLVNREVSA